jgi:hypothetical protein
MAIEFQNFSAGGVGELFPVQNFGWVRMCFNFADSQTNAHPSVEIAVPLHYDRTQSIESVHKAAFEKAKIVLETLTAVVASHDLLELRRLNDEREAAEAKELDRMMNPPD